MSGAALNSLGLMEECSVTKHKGCIGVQYLTMTVVRYMHHMLTCLADKRTRVDRYRRGSDTDTATNTKAKTAIVPALAQQLRWQTRVMPKELSAEREVIVVL
jgi:hypothetical protein